MISHNMPHVFEAANRIHIHRLGKRICVIRAGEHRINDLPAFITRAKDAPSASIAA